jgi:hypothetical protein
MNDRDRRETAGGEVTDTRIHEGELEARAFDGRQPDDDPAANLESIVASTLRDGETDDAGEAAEEGLTWVPPTDPSAWRSRPLSGHSRLCGGRNTEEKNDEAP